MIPPGGLLIATLPVVTFLALLVLLDSFKLVAPRTVLRSLLMGAFAAGVALLVNTFLLEQTGMSLDVYRRYVGPLVEELAKAAWLVVLLRRKRIGFVVDAAIHGFAVGTGFALVENIHYLRSLPQASVLLWVVRGLGTAVTHGSTTAIFAVLSKSLTDRRGRTDAAAFLPGFLLAATIHSLFNHFVLPPLVSTAVVLVAMPLLFITVFERSEKSTRHWLGTSFDSRMELLESILNGDVRDTHVGAYLQSLRSRFAPAIVADMLCYLRVHAELGMRAKAQLIARQAGLQLPVGEEVRSNLVELKYLEKTIGRTGKLALQPFLAASDRELWSMTLLR
jgi:RsiW-degrading membrane proteinase PrsW (M82 family)